MLCHTLNIAPGTPAIAIAAKCWCASEHASPLFCIPTSMLNATFFGRVKSINEAAPYPNRNPIRLCNATTIRIVIPEVSKAFWLAATTAIIIKAIAITDTAGKYADTLSAKDDA